MHQYWGIYWRLLRSGEGFGVHWDGWWVCNAGGVCGYPGGYWGPHGVNPFSPHPPPSPGILETDITFILIFIVILTLFISEGLGGARALRDPVLTPLAPPDLF